MGRPPKGERVKPSELREVISEKKLRSLLASARSAQKDIDEIAGGIGSEIKQAVEKSHLHRKAFAVIKTLDRMEPEKLADFLDNFEHYLEISGLNERAKSVIGMDLTSGEETEDEDGGKPARKPRGKGKKSNVEAFPLPQQQAAE